MQNRPLRVLIVDDDPLLRALARRVLRKEGWEVMTASSHLAAVMLLRRLPPDVLLIDVNAFAEGSALPTSGDAAAETTRVVLFSARAETEVAALARECNADAWVSKHGDIRLLPEKLRDVCEIDAALRATG
ncbi:MAG: response regulator [Myxococcales bacterium]|nr:response regulator [Myxococcales bacterium]